MGTQLNSILGLSVFSFGLYYRKAWLMGMEIWKHRACCYTSLLRAHVGSCTRCLVAASLRGGHAVLPGCSVWGGFVSFKIWTHLLLYSCVVHVRVWVPGIVYGLFSKEALFVGKASVRRTHSPGLAARLTEHFQCLYRLGLQDANKPPYRLLRRKLWSVRFFPLAVFPTISQTLAEEALAISMEAPMGKRGMQHSAQGRECQGSGVSTKTVELASAKEATVGEYLGLLRYPRSSGEPILGQASAVSRCAGTGHSFFSPLYTAQLREEHAYYGFQGPLYLFDPCRLELCLAYCAKGLNRSHHICKMRANMFPSFSSFPSDSVLPREFWIIFFIFIPCLPKEFFQVPSVVENIGHVKRKFHDVIGRMRCGPARRWVQTQLAVRKAGSKRWLRFFNGKRALRDVRSENFRDWEVDQFADALALRSLRAAPGVWHYRCDEINSECFSRRVRNNHNNNNNESPFLLST